MTLQEFQQKFDAQIETQNLDFKAGMAWEYKSFTKDILAMANLRDGGDIIIGVKEQNGGFIKEGISDNDLDSYKIDVMRDKIAQYADPAINFWITRLTDTDNKKFIVISIAGFTEIPVITKKQIEGQLLANTIYYRNTNRRIESAPISNSEDLRDIIEQAAIKMMRKRKNAGFEIGSGIKQELESELTIIRNSELLTKIKSNAYWEVVFEPLNNQNLITLKEKEELINKALVKLDWYFPVLPPIVENTNQHFIREDQYLGAYTDYGSRKECFAFFKSGQFICYNGLTEDWYAEDRFHANLASIISPGKYVTQYNSIIHYITGVIEFLSRLIQKGIYKEGVSIKLVLNNVKNREIYFESGAIMFPKKTHAATITLEETFNAASINFDPIEVSNNFIIQTFDKFNFHPDSSSIKLLQNNYFHRS